MGFRKHLRRTMQYCHQRGRVTIYRAHSYDNPVCHGFADYWYPGEQYRSLILRRKTDKEYPCSAVVLSNSVEHPTFAALVS